MSGQKKYLVEKPCSFYIWSSHSWRPRMFSSLGFIYWVEYFVEKTLFKPFSGTGSVGHDNVKEWNPFGLDREPLVLGGIGGLDTDWN